MNNFEDEFQALETDIAVCGSMVHRLEMRKLISKLETKGYTVSTPDLDAEPVNYDAIKDQEEIAKLKSYFLKRHFANIYKAKTVLIANYEKNGTGGYVGANTLLEMCAAFIYNKPIYVLNHVSRQNNFEEILGFKPIILNGDVEKIKF